KNGKIIDQLLNLLNSQNKFTRIMAAEALYILLDQSDSHFLNLFLDIFLKSDWMTRDVLTKCMIKIYKKDENFIQKIFKILKKETKFRRNLIHILGNIGDDSIFGNLIEFLNDD